MSLLDTVIGALASQGRGGNATNAAGGGNTQAALLQAVIGMLMQGGQQGSQPGGRQMGAQAGGGLGGLLGMAPTEVSGQLSELLPDVVDRLTPRGQVPQGNELSSLGNIDSALNSLLRR
jgi:hypothetical protein